MSLSFMPNSSGVLPPLASTICARVSPAMVFEIVILTLSPETTSFGRHVGCSVSKNSSASSASFLTAASLCFTAQ